MDRVVVSTTSFHGSITWAIGRPSPESLRKALQAWDPETNECHGTEVRLIPARALRLALPTPPTANLRQQLSLDRAARSYLGCRGSGLPTHPMTAKPPGHRPIGTALVHTLFLPTYLAIAGLPFTWPSPLGHHAWRLAQLPGLSLAQQGFAPGAAHCCLTAYGFPLQAILPTGLGDQFDFPIVSCRMSNRSMHPAPLPSQMLGLCHFTIPAAPSLTLPADSSEPL